ncbi:MAG: adenylate/guanylate cyclase domain-containing protein [Acidobacteriota bacterium]|nr:adenylate/guanylate cyclase domain-containing protein [Acidobacteriota bacterium]
MSHLTSSTESASIVVIDDTPLNLKLLAELLKRKGYHVRPCSTGLEGLKAVRDELPDLVLLDIGLPDKDGYAICEELKADAATREVPVIFISALSEALDKVRAFAVGGVDFISKPFQGQEVLVRIKAHLELYLLKRDLERRVAERTAELEALNTAYERFIPHEFLSFLNKSRITEVELGDQVHRAMAVMFTDIRDFTSLSETMTPQDNFRFINAYLRRVSPVIRRHGGVVDKYIGDSIMALFEKDDAGRALDAMVDIRREVAAYNEHRMETGRRSLQIGIGLHVGDLMMGIIGEEMRMESTVISDGVNLASRLESLTKHYGVSIIVSKQTLALVPDYHKRYHVRFLDLVQVKGKREPVLIYEMFDGDEERVFNLKLETRADFEMGLYHFHREEFADACAYFKKVSQVNIQDQAAWLFLNRATHHKKHGVPTDWVTLDCLKEPIPRPN